MMTRYFVEEKQKIGRRNYYRVLDTKTGNRAVKPTEEVKKAIEKGVIANMVVENNCLVFKVENPYIIKQGNQEVFNQEYQELFYKMIKQKTGDIEETKGLKKLVSALEDAYLSGSYSPPTWGAHGGDPGSYKELEFDMDSGERAVVHYTYDIDPTVLIENAKKQGFELTKKGLDDILEVYTEFLDIEEDNIIWDAEDEVQAYLTEYINERGIDIYFDELNLRIGKEYKIDITFRVSVDEDYLYEYLEEQEKERELEARYGHYDRY